MNVVGKLIDCGGIEATFAFYSQIDYKIIVNLTIIHAEEHTAISTLLPGGKGEIKTPRFSGQALAWR
jgi:hypothetical protein